MSQTTVILLLLVVVLGVVVASYVAGTASSDAGDSDLADSLGTADTDPELETAADELAQETDAAVEDEQAPDGDELHEDWKELAE